MSEVTIRHALPPEITIVAPQDLKRAAAIMERFEALTPILSDAAAVEATSAVMKEAKSVHAIVEAIRRMHKDRVLDVGKAIDAAADKIRKPTTEIVEVCKGRLRDYEIRRMEEARQQHEAALEEAAADGRMTPDLTQTQVEVYQPKVSSRKIKRVRIVDESLLPREYLMPNTLLIEQKALSGFPVPGTEVYEDLIVINR